MNRSNYNILYIMLIFSLSYYGCIATSTEIADLKDDIFQLQVKMSELQRNQADLSEKLNVINTTMKILNSTLEDTQNQMSLLAQQLDDIKSAFMQKNVRLQQQSSDTQSIISSSPSEIYRLAYNDFLSGKYDVAIKGFNSYIENFPNGQLVVQARYYIGEAYYSKGEWEKSYNQFIYIENNYPKSNLIPAVRLKLAFCLEKMGKVKESETILNKLIQDFPDSPEALTAQEKMGNTNINEK